MSHNNQNTPSAKDILDHIRNKSNPDTRATMHSKLKKMLQQTYKIELKIKSNSQVSQSLLIKKLLVDICCLANAS